MSKPLPLNVDFRILDEPLSPHQFRTYLIDVPFFKQKTRKDTEI